MHMKIMIIIIKIPKVGNNVSKHNYGWKSIKAPFVI